jgi:Mlc titration factor MtfA (ptsG expression regulator)
MLDWIRNRHRKELIEAAFPTAWMEYLQTNVRHYSLLSESEQSALRNDLRIFLAEKFWEGCGGQEMTDEIKVTISAHACLLTLGLDHDYYPNVESILVYPSGYTAKERRAGSGGIVEEGPSGRLGEAWSRGPVILSWSDALRDGQGHNPGHNVTLHEFAHKLDMATGGADGVPRLHADEEYDRWAAVMSREYQQLLHRIEQHEHPVIDPYGATNPAEFFAVSTEMFFEHPLIMRAYLPPLYEVLKAFYRQDTAGRARDESSANGATDDLQ